MAMKNLLAVLLLAFGVSQLQLGPQALHRNSTGLDMIVLFSMFCDANSDSSAIYCYIRTKGQEYLVADTTSSYADPKGRIIANKKINDAAKLERARMLTDHIPLVWLNSPKNEIRYGCPGCRDGCGLYLEIRRDTTIKKVFLPIELGLKSPDLDSFGMLLKNTCCYMRLR